MGETMTVNVGKIRNMLQNAVTAITRNFGIDFGDSDFVFVLEYRGHVYKNKIERRIPVKGQALKDVLEEALNKIIDFLAAHSETAYISSIGFIVPTGENDPSEIKILTYTTKVSVLK